MKRPLTLVVTTSIVVALAIVATAAVAAPVAAQEATPDTDTACGEGFVVTSDGETCVGEATLIERQSGPVCPASGAGEAALLSPDRTQCVQVLAPNVQIGFAACPAGSALVLTGSCVSAPTLITESSPRRCLAPEGDIDGVILSNSLRCMAPADLQVGTRRLVSIVDPLRVAAPRTPSVTVSLCVIGFELVDGACQATVDAPDTIVGRLDVDGFQTACPAQFSDAGDACERFIPDPTGIEIVRNSDESAFLCNNIEVPLNETPQCAGSARLSLERGEGPRPPVGECPVGFVPGSTSCTRPGISAVVEVEASSVALPVDEVLVCPIFHALDQNLRCVSLMAWPEVSATCGNADAIGIDSLFWCELDHEPLIDAVTSLACDTGELSVIDLLCSAPATGAEPTACPAGYSLGDGGLCNANPENCQGLLTVAVDEFLLSGSSVCVSGNATSELTFDGTCVVGDFISQFGTCVVDRADGPRATTCHGRTVTVDLGAGQLPTALDDVIMGTAGDDRIAAGDGNDVICGMGGNDVIFGQAGNDVLLGDTGDDRLRGGPGDDVVFGGTGADDLNGGTGNDLVFGQAGNDTAVRGGTGDDYVSGGSGDDALVAGNGGTDHVLGGDGNDKVTGGPRPDLVEGGPGIDEVKGNGGNDMLFGSDLSELLGGPGIDVLRGGSVCNGGTTGLRDDGSLPDELDFAATCATQINVP